MSEVVVFCDVHEGELAVKLSLTPAGVPVFECLECVKEEEYETI